MMIGLFSASSVSTQINWFELMRDILASFLRHQLLAAFNFVNEINNKIS